MATTAKPFAVRNFVCFTFIFVLSILYSNTILAQGCGCTNCPQFMPDGFTGTFNFQVMNAANPTLGQNGQGVCGVQLNFDHEYLGDLLITLTSPAGQTVTLVGPIGLFGPTDFTTWDVLFVPCADPATPDPGFTANWNNNQPWGLLGNYSGTYYPNNGCLENFNSGSVNGNWTLTVVDGQANDVGNFYDYEIIFCDPTGINCFSCAANAGALTQQDVSACQGSNTLNLNLPPTYNPASTQPPAAEYGYLYVISGPGGIIQEFSASTDMTGYNPGQYSICGLSYLIADAGNIPTPDGSLTVQQLTTQLNSNMPPFCGDVTTNCVNVNILPIPDNVEETVEICAPQCYQFFNQTYCQSGTYVRNLTQNGCPYTATLNLTIRQPNTVVLNETICEDGCSSNPTFPDACAAGSYQTTLMNQYGCDSTVILNVTVLVVNANIQPPAPITCTQTTVPLQGLGSTTGVGTTYLWTASNGGVLGGPTTNLNATATTAGDYQLRVCRQLAGAFCCDSAEVTVLLNQQQPGAPGPINGPVSICFGQSAIYSIAATANATSYIWTVPPGVVINSGQGTPNISVTWNSNASGNVCVAASNACSTTSPVCLPVSAIQSAAPSVPNGPANVCIGATESYSVPLLPNTTSYNWTVTAPASIVSGQGTNQVIVNWGNVASSSICVQAIGPCGTSQDVCLPVQITLPPPAGVITGDQEVCPGSVQTYSVASVAGATTYLWQVTGGVIISGAGSSSISVEWGSTPVLGQVCVTPANTCADGPQSCLPVNVTTPPAAGQIVADCDPTNTNYTISFQINGGTTPYSIPGGTVTNSSFLSNPIVSGQGFSFVITDANGCISDTISGAFNCNCSTAAGQMNLQQLAACADQTVTAQHQGGENLDGNDIAAYLLHSNAGTSLGTVYAQNTSGTFGIQAGMVFETIYYISYVVGNNVNGAPDLLDPCLSVAQGQPVVFHEIPVANAGIDQDTCGLEITLNAGTGIGTGTWSLIQSPAGGNLNLANPQNASSPADANVYGIYILSWSLDNFGCLDSDTTQVQFNDAPVAGQITSSCDAMNENYAITIPISGGMPAYSINGQAIAGNSYVSSMIPNGVPYSYVISDANGCVAAPVDGIFNCNCSTNAGQMNLQPLSACGLETVTAQYTGGQNLDSNDTLAFYLHSGSGNILGTIFGQNKTGVFGFSVGMSYGVTYYISVVAGNNIAGFPALNDPCLSVAQGQPVVFYPIPVADAGADDAICGTSILLNATGSGTWSLGSGPAGGTIQFDNIQLPNSNAIGSVAGTYTLIWTVTQNNCTDDDQVNIQLYELPVVTDIQRTCDVANENYTVTLTLGGGTAPYSINGAPIGGISFTSASFANGASYNFAISDANGCVAPDVNGSFSCNCATNAGTMPQALISACEGNTVAVTANNDQTLDGNDVVSYILHNGSSAALGQIFAQNNTGIFGFQNGMTYGTTYYVSLVAGNAQNGLPNPQDPCFSVAVGQPVVFLKNPTPEAGTNTAVCGASTNLAATNSGFPGTWTQVSGPGTAVFIDNQDQQTGVTVSATGLYEFQWTESNGICQGNDQVQITFNNIPGIGLVDEICNSTNTSFTIQFGINGGTGPYTVAGVSGTITGSNFNSAALANNSAYSIIVTDANGCESPEVSGAHNCNCATDAGTMSATPLVFCADAPAVATFNNNEQLDGDDILLFILHNQSGNNIGTVLAVNNQPSFNFGPGLQTGTTYYISAVAGNNLNGAVDLNDICLSVAPGTPVQWKAKPTASLNGDNSICQGNSTNLIFNGSGTYPLTLSYSNGLGTNTITLNNSQDFNLSVSPTQTTTYTLVSVADGSLPTCTQNLNDPATIVVSTPLTAGVSNGPLELCEGVSLPIVLSNLITGADFGGQWTETSVNPSTAGAFNASIGLFATGGQAAGIYTFKYSVSPVAPCPSSSAEAQVILSPLPVADAGENKTLNCNQVAVNLGGNTTTQTAGTQYDWQLNGASTGNTSMLFTGEPGQYTLIVTTPAGCVSSDEVLVFEDNELPFASFIIKDVNCNGDKNGRILVDSISSTHPPVLFSFNGGAFGNQQNFGNLAPGDYSVRLQDANGCEWTSGSLEVKNPPLLTVMLDPELKVELGDSAVIKAQLSVPLSALKSLTWNPLLDSLRKNQPEQRILPFSSQQFVFSIVDSNGCTASDRIWVLVDKTRNIFIPNIIKPGSDNNGIAWISGGKDVVGIESYQIYDRWGEKVYEVLDFLPNQSDIGWQGDYNGEPVNPGVYVYYAVVRFIDGEKILFKGDITVYR